MHAPQSVAAAALFFALPAWAADLRIEIRDERGHPAAARLEVHGPDGKMYQATGSLLSRPPGRPDTGSPYLRSFVAKGTVTVRTPPGRYRVIAEHGLEYERNVREVELTEVRPASLEMKLRPWIRMRDRGWWSGDMHVHRRMEDTPLLLEAEDLNLAIVFTMWNRQNLWAGPALPGDWVRQTGRNHWMTVTNGEDERGGGAWMLHGLSSALGFDKVLADGQRSTESWDPPGMEFVRQARRQKRELFPWFDLEKPIWWETPVMMALERPDSMGLLNNHYDQYGMYDNEAWGRKRDTVRFAGLHGYSDYSLHLMYRYWNLGWLVPPSAGAASGVLPNPVGYNRMYVKLTGGFTVEKWYEGLREGRVIVSNGPLVFFEPKADSKGRLTGRIEAVSRDPLERVELIANGKVIQRWTPSGRRFRANLDLDAAGHSWVSARVYAKNDVTVRLGHTGPFPLPGKWDRREDARFFREWIDEMKRNPRTPPGSKAAGLYEQALEIYRDLER
ncbi:MAG: hypothetical protein R2762_13960 [Bryobacteraceae bacterium]